MHSQRIPLVDQAHPMLQRVWATIVCHVIRPGRHDLGSSVFVVASVLAPLLTTPVAGQVGVGTTEQLLCQTAGVNIVQLVTIGLGIMSGYYLLKFLIRGMIGFDTLGDVTAGRDHSVNTQKKLRYREHQTRDAVYLLIAALLPVFVPVLLNVAGIDVVACLFP